MLNSLSGEAIDKSFSLCCALSDGSSKSARPTSTGTAKSACGRCARTSPCSWWICSAPWERGPNWRKAMLREVLGRFEGRNCVRFRLPRLSRPARAAEAFRDMAQAKHIGKLVVSMRDREGLESRVIRAARHHRWRCELLGHRWSWRPRTGGGRPPRPAWRSPSRAHRPPRPLGRGAGGRGRAPPTWRRGDGRRRRCYRPRADG